MKKYEILSLVNAGILSVTANDLDAAHAYKVLKFKRSVKAAFDKLADAEKELLKESGIEDAQAFDKERADLIKSGENSERLEELNKQFDRFNSLRDLLYKEEVQLEGVKTIPFAQFHVLQKENKDLQHKPLNAFEFLLENVLWAAPEEEAAPEE